MVNVNGSDNRSAMSKSDIVIGSIILVSAQLAAASTASCVHALPDETPSVLRGLWRQTLSSIMFAIIFSLLILCKRRKTTEGDDEQVENEYTNLNSLQLDDNSLSSNDEDDDTDDSATTSSTDTDLGSSVTIFRLVISAVVGAALLNNSIVIALQYASSAAVMCLCNTTPIWLILYAIVHCGIDTPGFFTILGASLSLAGAIICATSGGEGEGEGGGAHATNERLGAIIATMGGIGGAIYMTACRKLSPTGIHPIVLNLIINVGMSMVSLFLCSFMLPNGIDIFSTDITNGFFGFVNPAANPAAVFHSIFPDCFGNFGITLALSYFDPLIVSMVMLTEPLNASLIAMTFIGEPPPSRQTIIGVSIVLVGCGVVLLRSSKESGEIAELENEALWDSDERKSIANLKRISQAILLAPIVTIAPNVTAQAIFPRLNSKRISLPSHFIRHLAIKEKEESTSDRNDTTSNRQTLRPSIIRNLGLFSPSSVGRKRHDYGATK